jgi:hypothetical protein
LGAAGEFREETTAVIGGNFSTNAALPGELGPSPFGLKFFLYIFKDIHACP